MRTAVAALVALLLAAGLLPAQEPQGRGEVGHFFRADQHAPRDLRNFRLSPEVVADPVKGWMGLARSVLLADEIGATDFHQTEALSETVWARKVFALDDAWADAAELLLFGSAAEVLFNGTLLEKPARLESTGWQRVAVPVKLLRKGDNEVVLRGGGQLLIEPGLGRGRSFRSADGGRSWSGDHLGRHDGPGEYLVRLRLGRYPRLRARRVSRVRTCGP